MIWKPQERENNEKFLLHNFDSIFFLLMIIGICSERGEKAIDWFDSQEYNHDEEKNFKE